MARPPGKPDTCLILLVAMVATLTALAAGAVRVNS